MYGDGMEIVDGGTVSASLYPCDDL